jgi:autotransporter-associated beta strand protein
LGTANSAWTQGGITWSNQPSLTPIAGATSPDGTFGSGPVTWTIPWYMVEKMATTGSGYNNGLGITSGVGSTQHFYSSAEAGTANDPKLEFSAAAGASGTWTGGDGSWTTTNWVGSTVAEGIGQTATINGGTAVNITMDANRSVGSLSFSGANHTISGSGKLALNVVSGSPTISVAATRIATIGATLVGIDGLTKTGDGTLNLTAANTYTGTTTISAGTLQFGNGGSIGSLGSGAIVNNANLVYNFDASSTVSLPSGANISGSGNLSATAGVIKFNGNITQGGALNFTQTGAAALYKGLELVAANTTLTGSSITLSGDVGKRGSDGNSLALDTSAANGTINLDISLGRSGMWYIPAGFSANAGAGSINITGSGTDETGWRNTPVTLTGSVNMTAGVNSNAAVTIDSNTTNSGTVSGAFSGGMSLTKSGAGTLRLSSGTTHTYTGATDVTGGKLVVNGNISTSSLTTVQTGATLSGSGTVGSLTLDSGAFLNPGNSPGILNVDGDYNQAGTLNIEVTGTTPGLGGYDQVNVDLTTGDLDGSVTLGGSLSVLFGGGSYVNGNLLFILLNDESDAISETFSGLAQNAIVTNYGGFDWKISYTADSTGNTFTGGNDVALMAVPEPRAALLGGLGLLYLLRRRRA